ncbi:MAG: hypothetical protein GY803_16845 [Chloroflexi bacterium]|nr:hypothetical protein [Chloroflexota bacterium]
MTTTTHVTPELLKRFANGRLSQGGSVIVLCHLAQCDYCLQAANVFWMSEPENMAAALTSDAALRLKNNIMRRVRRLKGISPNP